jgi:hypothetical protein
MNRYILSVPLERAQVGTYIVHDNNLAESVRWHQRIVSTLLEALRLRSLSIRKRCLPIERIRLGTGCSRSHPMDIYFLCPHAPWNHSWLEEDGLHHYYV